LQHDKGFLGASPQFALACALLRFCLFGMLR
jgi:hypothetical protein